MRRCILVPCLPLLLGPLAAAAQSGMSQARMEEDCLQRLRTIMPREVRVKGVDFGALGQYATYYVVTYRFTHDLENGRRAAACTYRRDGQWVRDDAAAFKLARDLASPPPAGQR